jgi:hypothetical protein
MRLIIEARVESSDSELRPEPIRVAVLDRIDDDLEQLGLTLEEGRELLAAAQSALVVSQAEQWLNTENYCHRCCTPLHHKDSRSIVVRTVFGKVALGSPRFWSCACDRRRGARRHPLSPLSQALPKRITPELEYLQVKWAAHLPYAASTELLKEVLPLQECISATGAKTRIRTMGADLDAQIEREIAAMPKADIIADAAESSEVTAVSVDSAWLKHCAPPKHKYMGRQVNIVAGRATRTDGTSQVVAYVGKRVASAAARLDHFLVRQGVKSDERVTVISDGAGEFTKAVDGSQFARGRILDWFHIAMRFRAAEQSILGAKRQVGPDGDWEWVEREIKSAKWLVWHNKGRKAIRRLQTMNDLLDKWSGRAISTLRWNVRKLHFYLRSNARFLVNYGARYRKGLPISSAIAESAVNQVVSTRMAKRQQMRWCDEGAHHLALVRVADLNGELTARTFGRITQPRRRALDKLYYEPMGLAA